MQFIISHNIPNGGRGSHSNYYDSSFSISFNMSLAARHKLIVMKEGSLDQCTLSYPFLTCAGSSLFSALQAVLQ